MAFEDPGVSDPVLLVDSLELTLGERALLRSVELRLAVGASVAVMGPSGSGKSTLLSCILGLVRPDRGVVRIAGTDVGRLRGRALARHRQENIGMVFQFGELLPELTPVENVALAALLSSAGRVRAYRRAEHLLRELGVPADGRTDRLSGGERQRAAVARALINTPRLVLADEPTGSLDRAAREQVAEVLFALPRQRGCGLLVVTHDPQIAARADRALELVDGVLVERCPQPVVG